MNIQYATTLDTQSHKDQKIYLLLKAMAIIDSRTLKHCFKVASLMYVMRKEYVQTDKTETNYYLTGLLHDIGKLMYPKRFFRNYVIKTKRDILIKESHPVNSKKILEEMGFDEDIVKAVYQHHERVNGMGYPLRLTASDMTEEAKILGLLDSFSALEEHRPYRTGKFMNEALDILLREADLYDKKYLTLLAENVDSINKKAVELMEKDLRKYNCLWHL